ncbi:MAG: hypothetical protein NVSMB18_37100 [Acetobacteraceae bacterium]
MTSSTIRCLAQVDPLTLAISARTFRVIERPFLGLRRRYVKPEEVKVPWSPPSRPVPSMRAVATVGERP